MSRMDRIAVRATVQALRRTVRNWYVVGPVAWGVMLSPARHLLEGSALSRRHMILRLRDGRELECPIDAMQAFVEVFLLEDYSVPGLDPAYVRTIVDAGANIGTATVWFAGIFPGARIVSVEPGATALNLLRRNLRANGLSERVSVVEGALGASRGQVGLEEGSSTILTRLADDAGSATAEVEMYTLADVVESEAAEGVDLLKVDCEGSEYDILLSAAPDLLRRIRNIVAEYHPSRQHEPAEIGRHLEAAGFEVTILPHPTLTGFGNLLAQRRDVAAAQTA